MQKDLDYWGIDELLIESCCSLKYFPQLEVCINEKLGDIEAKRRTEEKLKNENFGNTKLGRFRSLIWETIEYPWTSDVARYLGKNCTPSIRIVYFIFYFATALISLSAVVVSTATFIISTAEELQAGIGKFYIDQTVPPQQYTSILI